ncbi:MAG: DUF86 domain-containing protein [Ignavibacteriales bacterium]|nr:DUF86 domain-containing protein [Ignavibacteriales bacterium]
MNLEVKKYLYDIKTSIDSIMEYLGEKKDFNFYLNNKLLRRAVERELEIIGEAAGKLLKIDSNFPIQNARKIVDVRNWVIHGYDKVDDVIVWGIISAHLPKLQLQVEKLLQDMPK